MILGVQMRYLLSYLPLTVSSWHFQQLYRGWKILSYFWHLVLNCFLYQVLCWSLSPLRLLPSLVVFLFLFMFFLMFKMIRLNCDSTFCMLQELVSQSKLLKVSLKERRLLETVLRNCEEWEHGACSLLQDIWCLLNMTQNGDGVISGVISEIEHLVTRIESTKNTGLSLGFDLNEIPKLEDACNTLQWCRKALFFCSVLPPYKVLFVFSNYDDLTLLLHCMSSHDVSIVLFVRKIMYSFSICSVILMWYSHLRTIYVILE